MAERKNVRCLFVAHDELTQVGGVHTWLKTLLPMLRDRDVECVAALFIRDGEGLLSRQLRQAGIKVCTISHFVPFRQRVRWLTRVIEENQIQVVVPNYLPAGFAAAAALRDQGIRTVAVLHSDDQLYRALIECQRSHDTAVGFDHAVPVSRFLEEKVHGLLGPGFPTTRIPCGINPIRDSATPPAGEFRLVYVGRLDQEQKRIREVTTAFCRAAREIPGVTADLIGDGCDRKLVEDLLAANGNPPQVRLLGFRPVEEVRQLLPHYHAKVLLSEYEGLPVSLLEAMSAGLVPICSALRSGIDELVVDRVTGLIVTDRGDGFIAAVRELSGNAALWQSISIEARAQVRAFDAGLCADKWAQVIKGVVPQGVSPAGKPSPGRLELPRWRLEFDWDMQSKRRRLTLFLSNLRRRLRRLVVPTRIA